MDGGGGGDPGFDPCECIFSHQQAMRRLISLLQQSQSYCTETECAPQPPGLPARDDGSGWTMAYFMFAWMLLAFVLFLVRPSSFRQTSEKPANNGNDGPPPPPAPIM